MADLANLAVRVTSSGIDWVSHLRLPIISRDEAIEQIRNSERYYVYIIWKSYESPMVPFYVGKGRRLRLSLHEMQSEFGNNAYKARIVCKHKKLGISPMYSIVAFFDDEQPALNLEGSLIARIGRFDLGKGPLTNRTDGGDGSTGHLGASGEKSATARRVIAGGTEYGSVIQAAKAFGVSSAAIIHRIKNGWTGFHYKDEGQREAADGVIGTYRKRVVVEGLSFESASEASRSLGIDVRLICKRIGYGWDGYFYKDQGQLPRRTIWGSRKDKVSIEVRGVIYSTISEASRVIGESASMVRKRALSSNFPEYRRIDGVSAPGASACLI